MIWTKMPSREIGSIIIFSSSIGELLISWLLFWLACEPPNGLLLSSLWTVSEVVINGIVEALLVGIM